MVADFVVVESVQRMAELEHDVVGNVDDVIDAGDAARFEPVFQPRRGRLDLHAANDARGEASAQFRRLDFDFDGVAGFGGGDSAGFGATRLSAEVCKARRFRARFRSALRQSGAIRGDFGIDHRAVRAIFDAGDVSSGKREARSELFRRRGDVDEILQPVVDNFHDALARPDRSWPR